MVAVRDYTGIKVGKLTALRFDNKWRGKRRLWTWRCDCGSIVYVNASDVLVNKHNSCGKCGRKQRFGEDAAINQIYLKYHDGELSFEDFKHLIKQPCYWCGKWRPNKHNYKHTAEPLEYHGLDRIHQEEPHNRDNVVSCCWTCNDKRSNMSIPEWIEWIQAIYLNRIKP